MTGLLRLLQLLSMTVWVGGLAFFAFVLAPVAFHVLPRVREAGLIVGATLKVFDLVALGCGAVFLLTSALMFRRAMHRVKGRYEMEFLLGGVMLLATAYLHFNLLPSMDADRTLAGGDISAVPQTHPARLHFDKLHMRSERVEGSVLLIGLAALFLISRESTLPAD